MTPKEKANELFGKFYSITGPFTEAKECALLAVDQIILEQCKGSELKDPRYQDERLMYWNMVKQEIEKL